MSVTPDKLVVVPVALFQHGLILATHTGNRGAILTFSVDFLYFTHVFVSTSLSLHLYFYWRTCT